MPGSERGGGTSLDEPAAGMVVVVTPYGGDVDRQHHYANAIRAEPGQCWRMVSRPAGYRVDTPTDCPDPCNGSVGGRWNKAHEGVDTRAARRWA